VNGERGWFGRLAWCTAAVLALPFTVHRSPFTPLLYAQQPDTLRPLLPGQDTVPAFQSDTGVIRFDSTMFPAEEGARRDSIRARNDSGRVQRYLAIEKLKETKTLTPPPLDPPGPEPPFGRLVFTRDSLDWAHAASLSDLLQRVPGVYLWRGGWVGQPEYPNFQARGGTSVEYWLDGVPYLAAGTDSVGVDPSIFSLSILDRVEIERWPGLLRVRLYTRNLDRLAPRSRIAVSRGAASFARYQASLERKTRSGLGFTIAGDNVSVPTIETLRTKYANTAFFLQGTYLPSPRWGLVLQGLRTRPDRDPVLGSASDTVSRGFPNAHRMDWQLRTFWRADTSGLGPRADLVVARTTASDSLTLGQTINSAGLVASLRRPAYAMGASAFYRSRWTSTDFRGTVAWAPMDGAALSGEAGYQRHDGGRSSKWVGLRGGIRLPLGLEGSASLRAGSVVAAPAVLTDEAQTLRDWQLLAGWERRWFALEGGLAHTAAYQPQPYQPYAQIPILTPSAATDWLTARARLTPVHWISFEGWVSDPRKPTPDGLPPRHFLGSGTIRTKFLRVFPSGTLDVELRLAVEHWETGVIGRDPFGDPVTLPGATYFRSLVQVALGSFQFFWDRTNLTAKENPYVPGLPIVGRPSEFGVRWTFAN
jgi:hypothetical protein